MDLNDIGWKGVDWDAAGPR